MRLTRHPDNAARPRTLFDNLVTHMEPSGWRPGGSWELAVLLIGLLPASSNSYTDSDELMRQCIGRA